ncbi:MAG: hypothetical protein ABJC04_04990 [Verrucomicrobiota bacterium]
MSKISKEKKQHIVLVLIGAAMVMAGLWYFVVKAQDATLANVGKKTFEMQDKVGKAMKLVKRTDEVESDLEKTEKRLEAVEETMATGDLYLWMINTISRFNTNRNVTLVDFQREILGEVGILPKFPYKAATFGVKGTGYYHDIGKFLAEFENEFPYARVQNLELFPATKAGGDEAEKLNFRFEIVSLIKPVAQ